ncbi:heme-binding protein [Lysinimonas soli]|uniref:Heme-binding protein n=1 Tax=Lysinimonas soli TaxID=1074233 RepID=A0ABW0NNP0_9MICO
MAENGFRATSRVLLIDPNGAVLMFLQYGKDRAVAPRWITPGGGVDPGEGHDEAAIRELFEETGLVLDTVPAAFFEEDFEPDQRWHPYQSGHWAWYELRVDRFEPVRDGWTEEELSDVLEWRWMTPDELAADEFEVEPAHLPALLRERLTTLTTAPEEHDMPSDLPVFTIPQLEAEPQLDLPSFDNDDAVDLGLIAVDLIRETGRNLAVRVVLRGDAVFQAKLKGTGPDNDLWLAGKAAVVERFGESSLLVRLRHLESGSAFEDRTDVDHDTMKAYGGSMPIRVDGELVGTITTSGEPDVVDHATTAEAVRRYLAGR